MKTEKTYMEVVKELIENNIVETRKRNIQIENSRLTTYYNIGKEIVKASKEDKIKYGNSFIKEMSIELTKLYGKGYDYTNLSRMKQFYLLYSNVGSVTQHFITWTHLCIILPIKEKNKRNYYINLVNDNNLSVRALKEQIEKFLLELGAGFAFMGSEKKIKIVDTYKYIDLLFLNIEENCYVVVELKINKLTARDIGQLELYINYIDIEQKKNSHRPTVGILICKKRDKNITKYLNDNRIKVTTYRDNTRN